jgi:hypothetical protein
MALAARRSCDTEYANVLYDSIANTSSAHRGELLRAAATGRSSMLAQGASRAAATVSQVVRA